MKSIPIQKDLDLARQQCETLLTGMDNGAFSISPDNRLILISLYRMVLLLERKIEMMSIR
jgi:hypothetical protein